MRGAILILMVIISILLAYRCQILTDRLHKLKAYRSGGETYYCMRGEEYAK